MAESIRGLTVEISADASSFNKEMSSMRKAAQQSQTELNALQRASNSNLTRINSPARKR